MDIKTTIIANRPFSGNRPLLTGLVWRVLFICFFILVVPLVLYSFFLYRHAGAIKEQEAFLELKLLSQDQRIWIDQKLQGGAKTLDEAKVGYEYLKNLELLSAMYRRLTPEATGEILLLAQNSFDLGWVTLAGSEPALQKMKPPCEPSNKPHICSWRGRDLLLFFEFLDPSNAILYFLPVQSMLYPAANAYLLHRDEKSHGVLVFNPEDISKIADGKQSLKVIGSIERVGARIPIMNTDYDVLVEVPLSIEAAYEHLWHLLSLAILLFVIIGGGLVFWLIYKMSKPLGSLVAAMRQVEGGDFNARYKPQGFGFEINRLGENFNNMLLMLQKNIEEREKQKLEKEKLAKELEIGHAIQKSLFPRELPHLPQLEIAASFYPANQVAGDFYDLHLFDNKLLIVMADAAGKGISACLFSLTLRGILRSLAESGKPLTQIIETANHLLGLDAKDSGMFITAWIGLLDLKSLSLEYLCQGHYPAILGRDKSPRELDTMGSAIGVETKKPISLQQVTLQPGDLIFLYTDGLVESLSLNRQGILSRFQSFQSTIPSQVLAHFTMPPPYEDDLTLLALRIQ